jgi:hypothetical protein
MYENHNGWQHCYKSTCLQSLSLSLPLSTHSEKGHGPRIESFSNAVIHENTSVKKDLMSKYTSVYCEKVAIAHTVLEDSCDKPIRIQSYCAVARLHGV